MSVIIGPQQQLKQGAATGESIGQNLAKSLQMLAQDRMARQQRQQEVSSGLQSVLGVSQQEAQAISRLPEAQQNQVFQSLLGTTEQEVIPQAAGQEPGMPPDSLSALEQMLPEEMPEEGTPEYSDIVSKFQAHVDGLPSEEKEALKRSIAEQTKIPPQEKMRRRTMRERIRSGLQTTANMEKAVKLDLAKRKQELAESKFDFDKKSKIKQQTQKFFDKTIEEGKAAREFNMRLGRMENLNNKKLDSAGKAAIIDTVKHGLWGVGIDLTSLLNPDSQEFKKLTNDFLKNAKTFFGSRVTQGEIGLFLETVPSLLQSREGRNRVIQNMKLLNKGALLYKKEMMRVIEENDGKRPIDLQFQVEKNLEKKMNKISEKFASSVRKKLPPLEGSEKKEPTFLGIPW